MANLRTRFWVSLAMGALFWIPVLALAAMPEYTVAIKGHRFDPAELKVPANTKIKLVVDNQDASAEEFESYELNREKVVAAKARITVFIGPLKAGSYKYFGDFHKNMAQGIITVQ